MILTHNNTCRLALILSLALSSSIISTAAQAAPVKKPSTVSKPATTVSPSKVDVLSPGSSATQGGIINATEDRFRNVIGFADFRKPPSASDRISPTIIQQRPSAGKTLNQIQKP
jgi:hypothetical protein